MIAPMRDIIDRLQDVSGRMTEHAQRLVRAEIELAKSEMADKAKRFTKAGVFAAIAGIFGFFAVFGLLIAAIWAIGELLPIWASALIVAVFFLVIAGLFVLLAVRSARKAGSPIPEAALANIQSIPEDLKTVRETAI